MRIKINGEDAKITISTPEASTRAGLLVVGIGWLLGAIWWLVWL